jgi:hypothetical protein
MFVRVVAPAREFAQRLVRMSFQEGPDGELRAEKRRQPPEHGQRSFRMVQSMAAYVIDDGPGRELA